ncbi:MAG: hypothetical protein ORN49_04165 [Rhodobacteraceae bacterium]|nr:hypothetical protein [Paracoccaceae bacterium]
MLIPFAGQNPTPPHAHVTMAMAHSQDAGLGGTAAVGHGGNAGCVIHCLGWSEPAPAAQGARMALARPSEFARDRPLLLTSAPAAPSPRPPNQTAFL